LSPSGGIAPVPPVAIPDPGRRIETPQGRIAMSDKPEKPLVSAFVDELGDMYDAEKRLIHAMPKMIEGVQS
jgi:hypothetical protein